MPNYSNRRLANLANAVDSATSGNFLTVDDSSQGKFLSPVWSTHISNIPSGLLDSSLAQGLFDSAYIQARQTDVGLDSAQVTSLIDTTYVQARAGGAGLDSAAAIALIDSAYVAARLTSGLDSAGISSIIDSDYTAARVSDGSGFQMYEYKATAGQTVFDSTDDNGETLAYDANGILVFLNGVLLLDTFDYTASNGTSVTLTDSSDSGANLQIIKYGIATSGGGTSALYYGDRGLRFGGYDTGVDHSNVIDYWNIASSTGNAVDFGDLTRKRSYIASCSNASRALSFGGQSSSPFASGSDIIDYVTIASTGNATDFGDMLSARNRAACESNGTRAIHGGGTDGSSNVNTIEYATIATTGNTIDFGDLSVARERLSAASNGSRIVFNGGQGGGYENTMDYVTGDTTGNAQDFGDLLTTLSNHGATGTGSGDRAIVFGGLASGSYHNVIQYFPVSTTGNSSDFGDLLGNHAYASACCNSTKAQFVGGYNPGDIDIIQQVTMATLGNATDFGDLTEAVYSSGATSGNAS